MEPRLPIQSSPYAFPTSQPTLPIEQESTYSSIDQIKEEIFKVLNQSNLSPKKLTTLQDKLTKIVNKKSLNDDQRLDKILHQTIKIAQKEKIDALNFIYEKGLPKTQNPLNVSKFSQNDHGNFKIFSLVSTNVTKKQAFDYFANKENQKVKNPLIIYENNQFTAVYRNKEGITVFFQIDPNNVDASIKQLKDNYLLQDTKIKKI